MKHTRKYLALLLALCMVMALVPLTAMAANGTVGVKITKAAVGVDLNVYRGLGTSAANLLTPIYEDAEMAIYQLEADNYTWKYAATKLPDGTSIYNTTFYFRVNESEIGSGYKNITADPGFVKGTGYEASGLKMTSNFPDYPATMTDIVNDVTITVPMKELVDIYFADPYKAPPVDPVLLDILGIEDVDAWGADPWGRWEGHGLVTPGFDGSLAKHEFATLDAAYNFMAKMDEYDNLVNGNDGKGVMHTYKVGESEQGTPMYYNIFSAEGVTTPEEVKALGRPVIFYQAQIHGNEWSPGEGALLNMYRLVTKELDVLDNVTVVMLARLNVDGSYLSQRIPANSYNKDLNRDNLTFDNQ